MFSYNLDTTEEGYDNLTASFKSFRELKESLLRDGHIPDCVGTIKSDDIPGGICIASMKDLGVFLGITHKSDEYLSLSDREALDTTVDVWGDDLLVSQGLFIPEELAWDGIEEFLTRGTLSDRIQWITPDEIPEDGNYII